MSMGQISLLDNKRTVLRTVVLSISLFLVLLLGRQASADTINTYDNFSSGTLDTTSLWNISYQGTPSLSPPSIASGSGVNPPQSYVLHASGTGSQATETETGFPVVTLTTKNNSYFSGHFGAALTFFNFTGTYYASSTDDRPPSISLVIGEWDSTGKATSNYYLVSRASVLGGSDPTPIIGWREYNPDGNTVAKGGIPYAPTTHGVGRGALEMDYDPIKHELNVGYFESTNPDTWNSLDPVLLHTFNDVNFTGTPFLSIIFSAGGGGTLSTDIGGLYYAEITDHNPVPLPPSVLLLAPGLVGLAAIRRRFNS